MTKPLGWESFSEFEEMNNNNTIFQALLEMGFDRVKAFEASTRSNCVEEAIDYCEGKVRERKEKKKPEQKNEEPMLSVRC